MKRVYLIISFRKLTDLEFIGKIDKVIESMTDNPYFLVPTPSLVLLVAERNDYHAKTLAASSGDRLKIAERKASRKVIAESMRQLGFYVEMTANGDEVILLSSGFDLAKAGDTRVIGPMVNPRFKQNYVTKEITIMCNKVKNAAAFIFFLYMGEQPNESTVWSVVGRTTCKFTLPSSVQPGQKCWGYIQAIGNNDQVITSEVFSIVAV
jgi:hypothetical protein